MVLIRVLYCCSTVFEVSVFCVGAQRYWLIVTWNFEAAWQVKCPCQPLKMRLLGFETSDTNNLVTRPPLPEEQQQLYIN